MEFAAPSAADYATTEEEHLKSSPVSASGVSDPKPQRLFSFGICTVITKVWVASFDAADVQYVDMPQGFSHGGTKRYYRDGLAGLKRAVAGWRERGVDFAMHLGDVIDGKNRPEARKQAISEITGAFDELGRPHYHVIGNHCLYNFPRAELNQRLNIPGIGGGSHYSFSPHSDWLIVVIDSYDISMLGSAPGELHHEAAKKILDDNNVNEEKNAPENMEGLQRRFVKFGGKVSCGQLAWLRGQLQGAAAAGQRVLVCSHQPLHPDSVLDNYTTLCWNYDEVLEVLQEADNVVACFAGHTHKDGFTKDRGVHFRVMAAILETPPDVYEDHLELLGVGLLGTQRMDFRERH